MIPVVRMRRLRARAVITAAPGLVVAIAVIASGGSGDPSIAAPTIASSSQVFAPTIRADQVIRTPSILATSAVRSPAIGVGTVTVVPAVIASTAAVSAPALTIAGLASIAPATIASSSAVMAPVLAAGAVGVLPAMIGSTSVVRAPVVTSGAVNVAPAVIASTAAVLAPMIVPGAIGILPGLIASTAVTYTPTVAAQAAGYDADASAAFAAMSVQPDSARKGLLNDLIAGIKADGDWTGLDWLVLHAAHDAQAGRLNLKNPAKALSAINSPSFVVDRGYTGDGTSAYLDAGEIIGVPGANAVIGSLSFGCWVNQQNGATGRINVMGDKNSGYRCGLLPSGQAGSSFSEQFRIGDGTLETFRAGSTSRTGYRTASRTGTNIKRGFFNGSRVVDTTTVATGVGGSIFAVLTNGGNFSPDRVAASHWGAGLSDEAVTRIYSRLNSFLTAIGAN